jgi:hypothetical protein
MTILRECALCGDSAVMFKRGRGMQVGAGDKAARLPARALIVASGLFAGLILLSSADVRSARAQGAAPATPLPTVSSAPTLGANLNISPKRVTFDRADRSATVYVFNQGTAAATFDIALIDRIMLPDGQIMPLAEAQTKPELKPIIDKLMSAQGMLVATPRRATLEPGKGQTIRIRASASIAGPSGTAPTSGEFRTHLTITTVPPPSIGLTAEQAAAQKPEELRFQINSVFGLSIPVILRIGTADVRGAIENPKISTQNMSVDGIAPAKPTSVLTFQIVRLGPNSLFGNLEVRGVKEKSGDALGIARGVGVYPEIDRRQVTIPLRRTPNPGELLEITFTDDDTAPGRLVAKTTFNTP